MIIAARVDGAQLSPAVQVKNIFGFSSYLQYFQSAEMERLRRTGYYNFTIDL